MRVLIAHSFDRLPGGEDRYVHQQVELLQEHHAIRLIGRDDEVLTETARTAMRMTVSRAERRSVRRVVSDFRPDVVHLHNAYPSFGSAVHVVAERRGLPLVQTVHDFRLRCPNGLMFTEGAACRRCEAGNYANAIVHDCFPTRTQAAGYASALWVQRFVLELERKVTIFVAPSRFMRSRLIEWGIPTDRIDVVPDVLRLLARERRAGRHTACTSGGSPRRRGSMSCCMRWPRRTTRPSISSAMAPAHST